MAGAGCRHSHDHEHEETTGQITVWTDRYEVFAEHKAPVVNKPTKFITHVTDLRTAEPRTQGIVKFVLRQNEATFEHPQAAPESRRRAPARAEHSSDCFWSSSGNARSIGRWCRQCCIPDLECHTYPCPTGISLPPDCWIDSDAADWQWDFPSVRSAREMDRRQTPPAGQKFGRHLLRSL